MLHCAARVARHEARWEAVERSVASVEKGRGRKANVACVNPSPVPVPCCLVNVAGWCLRCRAFIVDYVTAIIGIVADI